jgi:RNA polymerase sigma factor (TIGR02999 family)
MYPMAPVPMAPDRLAAPVVTELLRAVDSGSPGAREKLIAAVYAEMRLGARRMLAGGRARQRVFPTELVHGTALKLMVQQRLSARDRTRFVACSAQLMRRVLIDHTRPDGGATPVTLVSALAEEATEEIAFDVLHEALERLAKVSTEQVRLVELRHFGGMSIEEVAELDGHSAVAVQQDWRVARAWLHDALAH